MQILRVCDAETEKAFAHFPVKLYKDNPYWGHVSNHDLDTLFNPEKNPFFQYGEAERWIITNFRGNMIGRIAGFIDHSDPEHPVGGIGFFECINHPKAAFALFDQCKVWLSRKNVREINGPYNLLNPISQGGLLSDGFKEEALYGMPYHHAYYQSLFEDYGFELQHKQYNYLADLSSDKLLKICKEKASAMLADENFSIKPFEKKNRSEFAKIIHNIYNDAWKHQPGFHPISINTAENILHSLLPVLEEKTTLCAYYKDEPVGIFICIPEPEGLYKSLRSSKNIIDKLKLLFHAGSEPKITALMLGVKEAFQHKGMGAALFIQLISESQSGKKYKWLEISGVWDYNTRLLHIMRQLDLKMIKTFHTYQYSIKEEAITIPVDHQAPSSQVDAQL